MRRITNLATERQIRRADAPARPTGLDRHRVAVVQAEARRLARILEPFGVLRKDQLKRRARAAAWHEGGFDTALNTAVASGEIDSLPFGFYATPEAPEPPHRSAPRPGAA